MNSNTSKNIEIGIDPSINSTGVCVKITKNSRKPVFYYYIISSHCTKKMNQFCHKYIKIIEYPSSKNNFKTISEDSKNNFKTISEDYIKKSLNIYNICEEIEKIIKKYKPSHISMEGVSYGSIGSAALVDLAGLNFVIRTLFIKHNIPFTIVSPTENKKFATGNGQSEKDVMVDAWKRLDKNINNVVDIKIDDLADAFFLSNLKSCSN